MLDPRYHPVYIVINNGPRFSHFVTNPAPFLRASHSITRLSGSSSPSFGPEIRQYQEERSSRRFGGVQKPRYKCVRETVPDGGGSDWTGYSRVIPLVERWQRLFQRSYTATSRRPDRAKRIKAATVCHRGRGRAFPRKCWSNQSVRYPRASIARKG